jgi:hypothetical protein
MPNQYAKDTSTHLYEAMRKLWRIDWSSPSGVAYARGSGAYVPGEPAGYKDVCMGGFAFTFNKRNYEGFRILVYLLQDVDVDGRRVVPLSEFSFWDIDPTRSPFRVNPVSGYRGVLWDKSQKRYRAVLSVRPKRLIIKSSKCPVECAIAFNEAALEHYGDEAILNEIPTG